MNKDVYVEAAKILSVKMEITLNEAKVLVHVGNWQKTMDLRMGPFAEKMIEAGWVNAVLVTSSGMDESDIQSLFQKGYLLPRTIQSENGTSGCSCQWMRVTDDVERKIQDAFTEVEWKSI